MEMSTRVEQRSRRAYSGVNETFALKYMVTTARTNILMYGVK